MCVYVCVWWGWGHRGLAIMAVQEMARTSCMQSIAAGYRLTPLPFMLPGEG